MVFYILLNNTNSCFSKLAKQIKFQFYFCRILHLRPFQLSIGSEYVSVWWGGLQIAYSFVVGKDLSHTGINLQQVEAFHVWTIGAIVSAVPAQANKIIDYGIFRWSFSADKGPISPPQNNFVFVPNWLLNLTTWNDLYLPHKNQPDWRGSGTRNIFRVSCLPFCLVTTEKAHYIS